MSLRANAVTVTVGNRPIIEDISLDLVPGELVAVVGPNGAGKTTLLKALAGEAKTNRGQVFLAEKPIAAWQGEHRAKIFGVLPQQSSLNFAFSVEEVVMMGRFPHDTGRERDLAIIDLALASVDAGHLRQRCYTTLSGGEKQRVHLARVLAQIWLEPSSGKDETKRYLLLDEPTSALDLSHQHTALQVAKSLSRQGTGVLVILHDLNLAAQYADRVMILSQGRLVVEGEPEVVLTAERIDEVFGIHVSIIPHPETGKPVVIHSGQPAVQIPGVGVNKLTYMTEVKQRSN